MSAAHDGGGERGVVVDTISGAISARITALRQLDATADLDALVPLARAARDRGVWTQSVIDRFTARRLVLEAAWVARADWEVRPSPDPCSGCGRRYANVRGYGEKCGRCVRSCEHPGRRRVYGVTVLSDGGRRPMFACRQCGGLIDARRTDPRRGDHVFRDLRPPEHLRDPCSRCGRREGSQLHHWAPTAIFGYPECERWPKSWLCQECHSIWHKVMRRAGGYRLVEPERGLDLPSAAACEECGTVVPRSRLNAERGIFQRHELCPTCAARFDAGLDEVGP